MKDIGLGILDSYTVSITIITLVLSQVILGYQIPLDTTNTTQLFISLVVFTGYIYLARSLFRFPVAIIYAWHTLNNPRKLNWMPESQSFKEFILHIVRIIVSSPLILLLLFIYIGDFTEDSLVSKFKLSKTPELKTLKEDFLFVFFDRLSIFLIVFLATIHTYTHIVQMLGIVGLIFMATVFLLKGNFAALIEDNLIKANVDKNKNVNSESAQKTNQGENYNKSSNNSSDMSNLLGIQDEQLRLHAIHTLGKQGKMHELVNFIENSEKLWDHEVYYIIEYLEKMDPPAKHALIFLQSHRAGWIREEAIKSLINLGVDAKEPKSIREKIKCPNCEKEIKIYITSKSDIKSVSKATIIQKISRKSNFIFNCQYCNLSIYIRFHPSPTPQERQQMIFDRESQRARQYQETPIDEGSYKL